MLGSIRWNLVLAGSGMLLTFWSSLGNNGFAVSSLRSMYAFIAFFVLGYLIRFILRAIVGTTPADGPGLPADPGVGGQVDLSTPEAGEDLNELLKAQLEGKGHPPAEAAGFEPFQPKKIVSAQNMDPEALANAIRHLSDNKE